MRVISGKFGGRKLSRFSASHIRPTTDRAKESIFNKLGGSLEGLSVLDLFSGTGSLGIEALSRGAEFVQFVEKHPKSIEILKKNLELVGGPKGTAIAKKDVFKFLSDPPINGFDLVFIDPPFTEKWAHNVMEAISSSALILNENAWVIIESSPKELIEKSYNQLEIFDQKDFGDQIISYFMERGSS